MEEVLEVLDKESEKYGEWGQINIVTHGTAKDIKMKILKDSDKASMHVDKINSELERRPLESPSGINSDTQIVFRACKAGGEQELVETIHGEFFGYQGTLYIPKCNILAL